MTLIDAFAHTLKQIRMEKNVSQQKLALDANLDRTYISLLERGLRQPTITTLFQLAEALEIPVEELIQGTRQCCSFSADSRTNNTSKQ
ncbi:helix-turn-helix domain-containing protein [Thiomicrospira sp. S5]|uniref:helix-turn-helix domain-containing protein n=1 Tax=Thiomicrospira sp. S5 TaxID=1803865 RepID=UPI0009DCED15|nr:helix-turn-helix transcriptional regulator [Thiomicrospira sp. S5]